MAKYLYLLMILAAGSAWAQCPSLELAEDYGDATAFPLERTEVSVVIEGPIARVEVSQRFTNPFETPIDAIYAVPMSVRAAVNGYAFDIGDRTIEGQIKTLEEARRAYEEARAQGRLAALLEQAKENIFLQSLANIPPGEPIEVRFHYVEYLDYRREDGWRFVFPLGIKSRYRAAPGTNQPDLYRSGLDLDVSVRIEGGGAVRAIDGGVHAIESVVDGRHATVQLVQQDEIANEDFVLSFRSAEPDTKPAVLTHQDADGSGYFTLMMEPKVEFIEEDVAARDIVLIFDVSGSMRQAHVHSQYMARQIIESARPKDFINIITFAGDSKRWAETSRRATAATKAEALVYVDGLTTGGGTEFREGVLAAYQTPPPAGVTRHVFVLTDGAIGNDDEVIGTFRAPQGNNRIFPIGIAGAPNQSLLERIAQKGRGFTTYVYSAEDAEQQAQILLRRTRSPLLTNISVDWGELPVLDQAPEVIPDLFYGQPLVLAGRFEAPAAGQIIVRGEQGGRMVELPLQVDLATDAERVALPYVWARRRIAELTAVEDARWNDAIIEEVTRLGLKFSLVTAFTAFVAVDDGEPTTDVDGDEIDVTDEVYPPAPPDQNDPFDGSFTGSEASDGCAQSGGSNAPGGWLLGIVMLAMTARRRRS